MKWLTVYTAEENDFRLFLLCSSATDSTPVHMHTTSRKEASGLVMWTVLKSIWWRVFQFSSFFKSYNHFWVLFVCLLLFFVIVLLLYYQPQCSHWSNNARQGNKGKVVLRCQSDQSALIFLHTRQFFFCFVFLCPLSSPSFTKYFTKNVYFI